MLKFEYDIHYLVMMHYESEICKRSSEAEGGESCIVEKLSLVFVSHVYSNTFVASQ